MSFRTQLEQSRPALEALCRRHGVKSLALFGSALRMDFNAEASDLDFLVEFTASPTADSYFGLLESLRELFGRPVDLVVGSAIRNPYFLESVTRTKTVLYAA